MDRVRPKKHLGQHFLKEESIAARIVESLESKDKTVLEIGPGTGILTSHLIHRYEDFYALDVDEESVEYLHKSYPDSQKKILLQDFLQSDLSEFGAELAVIGNFPYNISSQIFFKVYDNRNRVNEVVGMIQKEVAERICSKHGNKTYGILSVLLQAFYDVNLLFLVKPGVFDPPPKVMSAVIRLSRNNTDRLDCDETLFRKIVKAGFGKRRKTLRNALKDLNLPALESAENVLDKRAEQLSVQEFVELTQKVSQ